MQYSTTAFFLSTLATIVGSQTIDPSSVAQSTRTVWCQNQIASCPLLCTQQSTGNSMSTRSNTCDSKSLAWTCVCGDGTIPAVANYSQTVPFYECQEFGNQCVTGCGGSASCASACRTNYPCGAQNPTRVNLTSSTTTSKASTATGSSSTGSDGTFGGAGASNSGSSSSGSGSSNSNAAQSTTNAAIAMNIGRSCGVAILASGIFAAFAVAL